MGADGALHASRTPAADDGPAICASSHTTAGPSLPPVLSPRLVLHEILHAGTRLLLPPVIYPVCPAAARLEEYASGQPGGREARDLTCNLDPGSLNSRLPPLCISGVGHDSGDEAFSNRRALNPRPREAPRGCERLLSGRVSTSPSPTPTPLSLSLSLSLDLDLSLSLSVVLSRAGLHIVQSTISSRGTP